MRNFALTIALLLGSAAVASALETDDYGFPIWSSQSAQPTQSQFTFTPQPVQPQVRPVVFANTFQRPVYNYSFTRPQIFVPRSTPIRTRTINVGNFLRGSN